MRSPVFRLHLYYFSTPSNPWLRQPWTCHISTRTGKWMFDKWRAPWPLSACLGHLCGVWQERNPLIWKGIPWTLKGKWQFPSATGYYFSFLLILSYCHQVPESNLVGMKSALERTMTYYHMNLENTALRRHGSQKWHLVCCNLEPSSQLATSAPCQPLSVTELNWEYMYMNPCVAVEKSLQLCPTLQPHGL